jgi:hypothetical protein
MKHTKKRAASMFIIHSAAYGNQAFDFIDKCGANVMATVPIGDPRTWIKPPHVGRK